MGDSFIERRPSITKAQCKRVTPVKRTAAQLNPFNWQSGFDGVGC